MTLNEIACMKSGTPLSGPSSESDEEILHKIGELRKDPEKFKEYVASRLDRAVRNWPRRQATSRVSATS